VAHFVGQVAAAGKAEYPLPLYANAALRDPLKPGPPSSYESGGPTDNVIPIWKAAAPALDLLAPDIYQSDPARYLKALELYSRPDNPLFVPETGNLPGRRALLLRRAGPWGDRLCAFRHRLHRLLECAAGRAAIE
jgi:beta-galactosidase GanA